MIKVITKFILNNQDFLFYTATDLYYLEKYAPIYPYQLIKFKTKQELIHYLKKCLPVKGRSNYIRK